MKLRDKTFADIVVDLIHLSKNSTEMYRLSKQQESEIHIINSENQAMIRFIGKELPDKYKAKVINEYKKFVKDNFPNKLNKLDIDDKRAINNLTYNNKKISGLLGNKSKSKPILHALDKLTKRHK